MSQWAKYPPGGLSGLSGLSAGPARGRFSGGGGTFRPFRTFRRTYGG